MIRFYGNYLLLSKLAPLSPPFNLRTLEFIKSIFKYIILVYSKVLFCDKDHDEPNTFINNISYDLVWLNINQKHFSKYSLFCSQNLIIYMTYRIRMVISNP